ncbi:hypothetical protein DFP72DRAFT_1070859 [Ephemerocybe angulata]|uniref:Uncharacterized protein n=1 Tax=Ephemerocybe angulata TaxID=980116 RepID=A0A8H6HTZ9_9AGAR|nr:hypothetical protein DFP72DRAFT_1070859 [Tulosesus angulatus]
MACTEDSIIDSVDDQLGTPLASFDSFRGGKYFPSLPPHILATSTGVPQPPIRNPPHPSEKTPEAIRSDTPSTESTAMQTPENTQYSLMAIDGLVLTSGAFCSSIRGYEDQIMLMLTEYITARHRHWELNTQGTHTRLEDAKAIVRNLADTSRRWPEPRARMAATHAFALMNALSVSSVRSMTFNSPSFFIIIHLSTIIIARPSPTVFLPLILTSFTTPVLPSLRISVT